MTNYEEILNNMTVSKLAYLMLKVPAFCPYNYGWCVSKYYDPLDDVCLCFNRHGWTKEDYIKWLESEVEE